ncbi:MAG: hypothetical protein ABIM49_00630 [candidate division WOR-3 bacterium]
MKPLFIFGLGEIGKIVLRNLSKKEGVKLIGVIDIDPQKVGKSVYEITGIEKFKDVYVEKDAERVLKKRKDGVVIHLTSSYVKDVIDQYFLILDMGHNIITTTEEMTDPYLKHPRLAKKIDEKAKKKKRAIVPTGVNPGFAMDLLPIVFSSVFEEIKEIRVERINNASKRRFPLQRKIGSGLTPSEFKEKWEKREIGHVGLAESGSIIARTLKLKIKNFEETCDPKIAKSYIKTDFFEVNPGYVCGILHKVKIETEEDININLFLEMSLDAENPRDTIYIEGKPSLKLEIPGGLPGDESTASIATNWIDKIFEMPPGLWTIDRLYLNHYFKKI